jgi:Domain of unknown function (DUF1835)
LALHVTNGDAVVPELAAAARLAPEDVLVWREILHDGPVPAGLGDDKLARVRARHITGRSWAHAGAADVSEQAALAMFRSRDALLAAHPADEEIVLWFEDDLFDRLLLAQVEDRLTGRPGPVSRVYLRHPPRGDLGAALAARERVEPDPTAFAALRSSDPRDWLAVPGFERLLEELPEVRTGLGRTERQILEALRDGPLAPQRLFTAVVQREDPPWLGDAAVYALAGDLHPLVRFADGRYELTPDGEAVLAGRASRPPIDRWIGGVHLGPGRTDWAWDPDARRPARLTEPPAPA